MNKVRRILPLAVLPCLLALFGQAPATQPATPSAQRVPGQMRVNSDTRTYLLRIPPQYDKTKPLPLVMVLHGANDDAAFAERAYGFAELGVKHGFFVVYADGAAPPPRGWNGLDNLDPPPAPPNDDVTFLRRLLGLLQREYRIDPARIYIAGHSMGAVMTYRMASECSDQIAAVAIVAGTVGRYPSDTIHAPKQPVAVIAFHGKADPAMPYESTHKEGDVFGAEDSMAFWVKADGCKTTPTRTESHAGNIITENWTGGRAATDVELVTIINGNHMWPGSDVGPGSVAGPDKPATNKDIDATALMWDFFERHPKQPIQAATAPATSPIQR